MDFDELLTPYVQGNLDESQRKYVEELAKADRKYNEKLLFEKKVANNIKCSAENFQEVIPSFDKLKSKLNKPTQKWWDVLFRNNPIQTNRFNPSLALASFAAICLGVYILFSQPIDNVLQGDFETLSNDDTPLVFTKDKKYLRMVFNAQQSVDQVNQIAEEFGFVIESGPDSLNSYIVSHANTSSASSEMLTNWRADSRIELVAPIDTDTSDYY